MARPRKNSPDDQAVLKIERAFWQLLEREPYAKITVTLVVQEAQVNRNSFYYHYENIDDLAKKALSNTATEEIAQTLLTLLTSQVGDNDQQLQDSSPFLLPHARRMMVFASSNSAYLSDLVKNCLRRTWFKLMAIQEDKLTASEQVQLDFIFSGLVAVLGRQDIVTNPLTLLNFAQTNLGQAILTAMTAIANR